jgi:hypothetical protein
VTDEIEAGREFLHCLNNYRPVRAACWLRRADGGGRDLYVALDGLTVGNTREAYVEVLHIVRELKDRYFDPSWVSLIRLDEPLARSLLEFYRQYPGPTPTRPRRPMLGGIEVDEVYIYPPIAARA